ncbi:hypothetical protein Ddye_003488 [Dipteronia dyeriana]|uniref:Uncharacterized protein n=1 Tax=Dipteronia dyeriana TaxID=168575 RepID=A0AAE0CVI7_9ROSI|nr:hypothetical protein Ddye_003488 [Dipteronia dyeriana]
MDLGCLDMGCISVLDKHCNDTVLVSDKKESDSNEPRSSNSKTGKNKSPKGTNKSTLNALNKFTAQIKKPPRRKSPPTNWFPRKKVDSYLNRKIKMLQEVDGMNLTLDETLGDTNPHYSRVLREKIAAREAAHKAMEARKAALVETSWCRILKAARIQSKEAEALLLKSEKAAAEAFEAAAAMGVIMYDLPNCPPKHCEIETSSVNGGRSSTHTVTASFETAFEVDKEVAAAVKTAFIRLAKCPSFSKDEFKDLLHKISENPDIGDGNQEISECESESGSEVETASQKDDGFGSEDLDFNMPVVGLRQRKSKRRRSFEMFEMNKLIDMMLERLKSLQEDELSSLATIVATCGLSAVLAEVENGKTHCPSSASTSAFARRMSSSGVGTDRNANLEYYMDGSTRRKQTESELPSLDKFLVKHMSKLEREVEEAKNLRMNESRETTAENLGKIEAGETVQAKTNNTDLGSVLVKHYSKLAKEIEEAKKSSGNNFEPLQNNSNTDAASSKAAIPDLGSMLVVKHTSKLQKEIEESKRNSRKFFEMDGKNMRRMPNEGASHRKEVVPELPSLDKFLVKRVSRLEKEVQEARARRNIESSTSISQSEISSHDEGLVGKENVDFNKEDGIQEKDSLDKSLVKPVHRLEKEKMEAVSVVNNYGNHRPQKRHGGNNNTDCDSLDKVLVKHVSRLEKEKLRFNASEEVVTKKRGGTNNTHSQMNEEGGSLDQVLVKHKSRLEREKMAVASQQPEVQSRPSVSRREARERELQEAWGGLSLGNSMRPHLSKLEKDKAAWIKAEEEDRRQAII